MKTVLIAIGSLLLVFLLCACKMADREDRRNGWK